MTIHLNSVIIFQKLSKFIEVRRERYFKIFLLFIELSIINLMSIIQYLMLNIHDKKIK